MKKTMLAFAVLITAAIASAMPHPRPRLGFRPPRIHPPMHGPRIPPPPPRHHHAGAFWTGVGTGILLDALIKPTPVVVTPTPVVQPVVVQPAQVWVPPVYETRPVYNAFGNIIRYEQVLVKAGYWR